MQEDFHYYAAYCAAFLAGYSHEESLAVAYSDQFTDCCTRTMLASLKAPAAAATTQLQLEMMDAKTDLSGLQDITRIWASFHFLPKDLYADVQHSGKRYRSKFRLICGPNGDLVADTIRLAKDKGLQAAGLAMHVLCDTWAHSYFAGTPSLVINNTNYHFFELLPEGDGFAEREIKFVHNPTALDDLEKGVYTNSLFQSYENSVMNLGHGRAGHLPDYSFMRYRYLPAWGGYREIIKDNPSDYRHAFAQMVFALRYLRGDVPSYEKDCYDWKSMAPYEDEIRTILEKRQLNACIDWKAFGEKLSGETIDDFDAAKYQDEYRMASKDEKDGTFLGSFFLSAMAQKSMVTGKIFQSGNMLAGFSVDTDRKGLRGIRDYWKLVESKKRGNA